MLQGLGIKELIDEWAAKYFPLAVWLANEQQKKLPASVEELDDLIGAAALGLATCLHGYDPSQGTSLSSWVSFHIRWAMLDYLKSLDFLPQKQRRLVRLVQGMETYLEQWFRREPTRAEIAAFLKRSEEDVERILQLRNLSIVLEADEDPSLPDRPEMGTGTERPEKVIALRKCFAAFTVEEKTAVRMYSHGKILEHIADALQISLAAAGRLVSKARQKLEESIQ